MKKLFLLVLVPMLMLSSVFAAEACTNLETIEAQAKPIATKVRTILAKKDKKTNTIVKRKLTDLALNKNSCERRLLYYYIVTQVDPDYEPANSLFPGLLSKHQEWDIVGWDLRKKEPVKAVKQLLTKEELYLIDESKRLYSVFDELNQNRNWDVDVDKNERVLEDTLQYHQDVVEFTLTIWDDAVKPYLIDSLKLMFLGYNASYKVASQNLLLDVMQWKSKDMAYARFNQQKIDISGSMDSILQWLTSLDQKDFVKENQFIVDVIKTSTQ